MKSWFAATSKTGPGQAMAELNLRNQLFTIFSPLVNVEHLVRGEVVTREERLFPGYIFIYFDPEIRSAKTINNTRGVGKLITFGDELGTIPEPEMHELMYGMPYDMTIKLLPNKGDVVAINSGPLKGMGAIFDEPNGARRSFVILQILGRRRRMAVQNEAII